MALSKIQFPKVTTIIRLSDIKNPAEGPIWNALICHLAR
jgi:hypothetical protein